MHGGKRSGSGRKLKYKTKSAILSIRVPVEKKDQIKKAIENVLKK
jgi:hypothetical protein